MMYKFTEKLPPRDPNFRNLSVDIAMLLDTGFMATGFVRFWLNGDYTIVYRPDGSSRYMTCKAESWREIRESDKAEWRNNLYSEYELKLIADIYPTASKETMEKLIPGKSSGNITAYAIRMGIHKEFEGRWSNSEIKILRSMYAEHPTSDILELLPGRSTADVNHKAHELGIKKRAVKP